MEIEIKREEVIFTQDILVNEMQDNQPYGYDNGDGYCDFSLFIKQDDNMYYCPVWEDEGGIKLYEIEKPYQGFYAKIDIKNIESNADIGDLYVTYIDLAEQYNYPYEENPVGFNFFDIESTKPNVIDIQDLEIETQEEKQTAIHTFSGFSDQQR